MTKTLPDSSSNQKPFFSGEVRSISKQTLTNRALYREKVSSSTLRSFPRGSVMESGVSPSQSLTCKLWSCTYTMAFFSLVVVDSKKGCQGEIWRVSPFTFHDPSKTIFWFVRYGDSSKLFPLSKQNSFYILKSWCLAKKLGIQGKLTRQPCPHFGIFINF